MSSDLTSDKGGPFVVTNCPNINCEFHHKGISIKSNELNCHIFRCGVYKDTGYSINPHSSKNEIDRLIDKNMIFGCGQAFKIISENIFLSDKEIEFLKKNKYIVNISDINVLTLKDIYTRLEKISSELLITIPIYRSVVCGYHE